MTKYHLATQCILAIALPGFTNHAAAQLAQAETSRHELSLSVSSWSVTQLFEGVHTGEDGYSEYPIKGKPPVFTASYKYFLGGKVAIGICVTNENESGTWNTYTGLQNTAVIGTYKRNVFTVAPEVTYIYAQTRDNDLIAYSTLSIGYQFFDTENTYNQGYYNADYRNGVNMLGNRQQVGNNIFMTGQYCPLGISAGGKLRGFLEFGFGYKGLLNTGLVLRM